MFSRIFNTLVTHFFHGIAEIDREQRMKELLFFPPLTKSQIVSKTWFHITYRIITHIILNSLQIIRFA